MRYTVLILAVACLILPTRAAADNADFNGDGAVTPADFDALRRAFGSQIARYDLNENGTVDFADFLRFLSAYRSVTQPEGISAEPVHGGVEVFDLPTIGCSPEGIVADSRTGIWVAELRGNKLARFDPRVGSFAEYPLLTPGGAPYDVAVDPNGDVWFTLMTANRIGRLSPASEQILDYRVPTPGSSPRDLALDDRGGRGSSRLRAAAWAGSTRRPVT